VAVARPSEDVTQRKKDKTPTAPGLVRGYVEAVKWRRWLLDEGGGVGEMLLIWGRRLLHVHQSDHAGWWPGVGGGAGVKGWGER
jgi:hypothetical protein